ncbi:MAG: hypothetical protein LWX83_11255 [Anaerolineae bacterium]|nr:hypothetical protein [Anaerolineae bacterium]
MIKKGFGFVYLLWGPAAILIFLSGCAPQYSCLWQGSGNTQNVLFIGNSYTFTNDLPGSLSQLACSAGHKLATDMAAEGGWTLAEHAASDKTLEKIKQKKWDRVVLQDQSILPAFMDYRTQKMYPAVRLLAGKITQNGSQMMLFNTWAHRNGLPEYGITSTLDMQSRLNAAYGGIGLELGAPIVPVGKAWMKAVSAPYSLDLWQEDGSHPNPLGTYLTACVFYASIYQESPSGLPFYGNLNADQAETLQNIAAETVLSHK